MSDDEALEYVWDAYAAKARGEDPEVTSVDYDNPLYRFLKKGGLRMSDTDKKYTGHVVMIERDRLEPSSLTLTVVFRGTAEEMLTIWNKHQVGTDVKVLIIDE